uniref:DUF885 family protein n=1 Tax=Phenylobacterium glaciei TaxID=2803784 RepID=A0A974P7N1_9CAUL|nr:DUF885 family protein [Phenylobacterium glaciei]
MLVHLKLQLRVCANALLDQAVHVDGISRDDAMKLMTVQAFQQEREAAGKWVRAQLSQAQLPTYFVGWEEHKALRKQAEAKWGKAFTLKRYHDGILAYGSPRRGSPASCCLICRSRSAQIRSSRRRPGPRFTYGLRSGSLVREVREVRDQPDRPRRLTG